MAAAGEVTVASHKRKAETAFGRKGNNRAVISDTVEKCSRLFGHPRRSHACVLQGAQERYTDVDPAATPVRPRVRNGDCGALARELSKQPGAKVWLLNMASATTPGGGARSGSNAQEEHLCRCSNLMPQLEKAAGKQLYPLSKVQDVGTDFTVLLREKVVFFKRPCDYADLPEEEIFCTGVLTAAAEKVSGTGHHIGPNAQRYIDFLLDVVHMQGEKCSHIILSAWGCGAFGQNACAVAGCFKQGLARFDAQTFPTVTFAIIDDHNSPLPGNLHAFRTVLAEA